MKTIEIIGWLVIIVAVYFNIGFFSEDILSEKCIC